MAGAVPDPRVGFVRLKSDHSELLVLTADLISVVKWRGYRRSDAAQPADRRALCFSWLRVGESRRRGYREEEGATPSRPPGARRNIAALSSRFK
jgi:hypothetical protein